MRKYTYILIGALLVFGVVTLSEHKIMETLLNFGLAVGIFLTNDN
jgi:hypothetical protein